MSWPAPSIAALIPAYKPPAGLSRIVSSLLEAGCERIVVIDDGSGPEHEAAFEMPGKGDAVAVIAHPVNLGKGAALKTGFLHLLGVDPEITGIVTLDADGQHRTEDVLRVARALAEGSEALVLGAREMSASVPWRSRFGNTLTRLLFRVLHGSRISDTQTGLRGVPRSFVPDLLSIAAQRYDYELDMLIRACATRRSIREVPIETVYFDGNRVSHFNPVFDSLRIYFSLFRFTISSLAAFVLDTLVFYIALTLTGGIATSMVAGRMLAMIVNFLVNRSFVFLYRRDFLPALVKYLTLVLLIATLSYVLILSMISWFGLAPIAAKLIAESALFVFSYLAQRYLVFAQAEY